MRCNKPYFPFLFWGDLLSWKDNAGKAGQSAKRYGNNKYQESRGLNYGYSSFNKGGKVVSSFGRAAQNSAYTISGSWSHLSWKLRGLVALVVAFAIFFVPYGAFQYAGWTMYLSMAWIINGFYWFIASIMNALLNMFISSIDTIFEYVTQTVGGTYQPLESWTLTTGTLLNPDVFKPDTFDTRYLAEWVFDNFGTVFQDMYDYLLKR